MKVMAKPHRYGYLVLNMLHLKRSVNRLKQDRITMRVAGALLILLLAVHCSLAGPEPTVPASEPLFSRDAITMALVVSVIGGLVQWAVITADSRNISKRRMLGSVVLAGVGGAAAAIFAMDQVRSPMIAALIGIGAAYAGGEAVLRRLGEAGERLSSHPQTLATVGEQEAGENPESEKI